jgi:hypothetical protein
MLPVVQDGRLVGTISREDIVRGLQLRELQSDEDVRPRRPFRRRNVPA